MIILGISDHYISGAAVIIDGKIVSAVAEERLERKKMVMVPDSYDVIEIRKMISAGTQLPLKELMTVSGDEVKPKKKTTTEPYSDAYREVVAAVVGVGLRQMVEQLANGCVKFLAGQHRMDAGHCERRFGVDGNDVGMGDG